MERKGPGGDSPGSGAGQTAGAALRSVAEEYADALGVDIRVWIPPDRFSRPRGGRGFHVHVFALPLPPRWFGLWPRVPRLRVTTLFGYPLAPDAEPAFAATGLWGRVRTLTEPDGQTVAELLGTNLYILFDLPGQPPPLASLLFRRVLDVALDAVGDGLRALSFHGAARLRAAREHLRRRTGSEELRWVEATTAPAPLSRPVASREEERRLLERERDALRRRLKEYSTRVTAETRRLRDSLRRLRGIEASLAEPTAHAEQFDILLGIPEVRHVDVRRGVLRVFTDTLYAACAGKRYRLGRYRIDIRLDGGLYIRNLTDRFETYDHPHIDDGRPCLGNIQEWVAQLVNSGQLVAAAQVLIEYLKTVNPQDWRKSIAFWPEVPR